MPYLATVGEAQATGRLKRIYKMIKRGLGVKKVPVIFEVLSLKPPVLEASLRLARLVTFGGTTLGRRREEMLSTAVSAWNHCPY